MSGKTTAWKTVYFILSLIRVGLPVPVESVILNYPEHISFLLKSSGSIKKDFSTFGEKINFFTHDFSQGSYILIDELFLSTDPVNGAELSEIIIKVFLIKDVIFFCTTHYSDVLDISGVSLSRMLEPSLKVMNEINFSIKNFIEKMPYQLQKISGENHKEMVRSNKKPLELALLFSLPEEIKHKIRKKIDQSI